MTNDMRVTVDENKYKILSALDKKPQLQNKELILLLMEFSYASAFCARTCDMNESWYSASEYEKMYKEILQKIKEA